MIFLPIISESTAARLWSSFVGFYDKSVLLRFIQALSRCFANSCLHCITEKYINKKPYFQYSVCSRLIKRLSDFISSIGGNIVKPFTSLANGSTVKAEIESFLKKSSKNRLMYKLIFVITMLIGYIAGRLFKGSYTAVDELFQIAFTFLVFFMAVAVFFAPVFRSSLLYRLFQQLKAFINQP